ncbi:MAG: hypothetical protein JWM98_3015 [Thermoleophilia bacterium]|nr:hypothetical protein [Thermoleophilia bacterium]
MAAAAWSFAVLGAVWWAGALAAGVRTVRALVRVDRWRGVEDAGGSGDGSRAPASISIIVAARDEALTVRHDVEGFAAFDDPDVELVLVDDRSTDGTGAIFDEMASASPSVQAIHVRDLPTGWLGKVHALEAGRVRATGEWLLFTDADVELAPRAPRAVVEYAEAHGLDALALLPEVESDGLLIAGVVGTFSRWLVLGAQLWRAADPDRPEAFGVGACNLVRADVLDRAGGFEWVRMDVADDAALGQLVAAQGGRTMLASGVGLVRVRWQESVRGMTRGFEKYGASGGVGSTGGAIATVSVATLGELAPWVAVAVGAVAGAWSPAAVGAVTIAASMGVGAWLAARTGGARRGVLVQPVASALVWWMQVRAAWLEHRRGGVVWRGTFYATGALRAGKRYRLPGLGGRAAP